jgi:hypothetical protein
LKSELSYLLKLIDGQPITAQPSQAAAKATPAPEVENPKMMDEISYLLTLLQRNVPEVSISEVLKENAQLKIKQKLTDDMLSKSKQDVKDLKFYIDQQKMDMVTSNTTRKSIRKSTGFKF